MTDGGVSIWYDGQWMVRVDKSGLHDPEAVVKARGAGLNRFYCPFLEFCTFRSMMIG